MHAHALLFFVLAVSSTVHVSGLGFGFVSKSDADVSTLASSAAMFKRSKFIVSENLKGSLPTDKSNERESLMSSCEEYNSAGLP